MGEEKGLHFARSGRGERREEKREKRREKKKRKGKGLIVLELQEHKKKRAFGLRVRKKRIKQRRRKGGEKLPINDEKREKERRRRGSSSKVYRNRKGATSQGYGA